TQTTAGTLKGKVNYMPKEQALGKEVDRRADTWALGAVLYFLLTGSPPYNGESQLATLQLAMNGAPIPPLPENVPPAVRTVVMRALSKDISHRFQTAMEMAEALERAMFATGRVAGHTDVALYVRSAIGDKLAARKQLIARSLEEAGKRADAGSQSA